MKYLFIVLVFFLAAYGGYRYGTRGTPVGIPVESPTTTVSPATTASAGGQTPTPPAGTQKPAAQTTPKTTTLPRIRLMQCVATPNAITLKEGSAFAVDNLDYTSRKVNVDVQVFNIAPQNYVTVVASPIGIHSIICDGGGVATLTVQP